MDRGKAKSTEMQNQIIFTPQTSPSSKSDSSTASSNFTFEADSFPAFSYHGDLFELQRDLITKKIAEITLKYNNCFICLQETIAEEILLQDDNLKLRDENLQLSLLVTAKEDEILASISVSGSTPSGLLQPTSSTDLMNQVSGERKSRSTEKKEVADTAPRGMIPKAISVRSNEFLPVMKNKSSINNTQSVAVENTGSSRRLRVTAKDSEGSKEVELEVYKQGMTKTELCNKWEETGYCPYGDRCQFAHGVHELRPVLRHPKYKTELCRMISSGGTCPYGHRCHFRHALDPNEEKQVLL